MRICKVFKFEAAHRLAGWPEDHQCHNLHGHSYKVEVGLVGPIDPKTNAIVDFAKVSEAWKHVHTKFDHQNLNEVTGEDNTTAEFLSLMILSMMQTRIRTDIEFVRVWETDTAYAEARING